MGNDTDSVIVGISDNPRREIQRQLHNLRVYARYNRRDAEWGNTLGHIVNFLSGFFDGLTISYKPTLYLLLQNGAIDDATYHQLVDANAERTGGSVLGGVVGFMMGGKVPAGVAFLEAKVSWLSIKGTNIGLTGRQFLAVFMFMMKQTDSYVIDGREPSRRGPNPRPRLTQGIRG